MEIHLTAGKNDLRLPVLPEKFEVQSTQSNETVTVHTVGEVNLLGTSGLKTMDLSSFFPNQDYNFAYNVGRKQPYEYINQLAKWKDNGTILELTITDTNINFDVTIESLTYSESDVTGDVNYSIQLKEYRTLKRINRTSKGGSSNKYKVKKGDTLKKIAKKTMGKASYSKKIYKKNKKVIEAAVKKYVKKENARRKKYNKKHPKKKKKLLKWKSSNKGKRLIPGTVLIIPKVKKGSAAKKKTKKKSKKTKKKK